MKAGFLLDVNAVIAMAWPTHRDHEKVMEWLAHPAHRFWADEVSLPDSLEPFGQKPAGHQQVTDAYLLGLAIRKKGKLVTMDRGVRTLLPEKSPEQNLAVLI